MGSDRPRAAHDLTMSKSDRDSLHGDRRTGGPSLSRGEMGTIVHLASVEDRAVKHLSCRLTCAPDGPSQVTTALDTPFVLD